jgi:hypothetical protein
MNANISYPTSHLSRSDPKTHHTECIDAILDTKTFHVIQLNPNPDDARPILRVIAIQDNPLESQQFHLPFQH